MVELLTIEETAKILKVKSSTLRTWINRKLLPSEMIIKIGATIRIRFNVFKNYVIGEGLISSEPIDMEIVKK